MAEAHPVGFRWVMKAKERGAKVIHVDPRFSRTSAMADLHVPIRAGSDIAFVGGLIRHVLETESYFKEYVLHYTNAATLINEEFEDTEDLGGFFSGFDSENGVYDPETWTYEGGEVAAAAGKREHTTQSFESKTGAGMMTGEVKTDPTLQHPRCVINVLKRHFARYTPEMVERITRHRRGAAQRESPRLLIANSGRERTTALCYAVGWTQHTAGTQMIRAGAILQLLLGNIGRPGGGVLALRGHATIQGSTDIPTLYDLLPGYLNMPHAREGELDLETYVDTGGADKGWWSNFDKYIVSLLKAWFGDAATKENDYGFEHLPKITGNHSHFPTMLRALDGGLDGILLMGQNPAVGSMHAGLMRRALASMKWVVVRDLVEIESATFWRDSPEVRSGELKTEDIQTEVFLMPAASHIEKEGSFTQTQRLVQWRDKALDPPGDARSDLWFIYHLFKRVQEHYADSDRRSRLADPEPHVGLGRRGRARRRSRCSRRSAATRPPTGKPVTASPSSRTTAAPPAAAGSTPASTPTASTRRSAATPATSTIPRAAGSRPSGAGRGRTTAACSTTRASADPEGKPWSRAQEVHLVGQGREASGPATTRRTSRWTSAPDYRGHSDSTGHGRDRRRRPVHHDGRRSRVAVRTVRACSTDRCRRTTSRSNRRSRTRCIPTSTPIPRR